MILIETWRSVHDYEGYYEVSNLGNVRSLSRETNNRTIRGRLMKPFVNGSGYLQVTLSKLGVRSSPYVHKMVAQSFLDNPSGLTEVNHINHVKEDCTLENLEWCTREYNMKARAEFYDIKKTQAYCHCGTEVSESGNECVPCASIRMRRADRPTKQELSQLLSEHSFCKVGRMYNVSDNAIRKWCKSYGLSTRAVDYKQA